MKLKSLFCVVTLILAVFSFSFPAFSANTEANSVTQKQSQSLAEKPVNINTADAQTIINAHIKGIGKKRAEAIIDYRTAHGPFKSIEDLKNIKGLSEKLIEANRHRLAVE